MYNAKNYTEQNGEVTHIGGKLVIDEGGSVEGLPERLVVLDDNGNSVSENVGAAIVSSLRAIEKANIEKLSGVFGAEARWTDKELLSDRVLKNLIEHFSTKNLTRDACPEDEFGQGYE